MATEPPRIIDWQPSRHQASHRPRQPANVITPSEAFKRGFYGGLGLWCSFMVLNILAFLLSLVILMALGVITAGAGLAIH